MKYLEGELEQGGLKAKVEAVTTNERSPMRGERVMTTSKQLTDLRCGDVLWTGPISNDERAT